MSITPSSSPNPVENQIQPTIRSERKLLSVETQKDSDGIPVSVYTYEVEKNGKTVVQTVKTRKTRKYKENKFNGIS